KKKKLTDALNAEVFFRLVTLTGKASIVGIVAFDSGREQAGFMDALNLIGDKKRTVWQYWCLYQTQSSFPNSDNIY
ncbi:MAG TPA: hypothetical protein PLB18_22670, partial [Acidobacteriota bacterium]|nr:hypothetical protein [Acidobacteriota bacterium]